MQNGLNEQLDTIKQEILNGMETLESSKAVYEFKKTFMDSKTGKIGQLMKGMKDIAPEDRAEYGKSVNALKEWALNEFEQLDDKMKEKELIARYESEKVDISMPANKVEPGKLHPITLIRNQLIDIFASMGFEVFEGTEIETDYYNFTALNTPQDHQQDRFTLWRILSHQLKFCHLVKYSVQMMMLHIRQCSLRWKAL